MKRFYILLLLTLHAVFFMPACHAHGRVEEAFRALLAVNRHPQPYENSGQAPAATQLLIPNEYLPLIMDVYKAMEDEHEVRTVFFRQDLGSSCANGIELQGRNFEFAGQYNNVLGGFTDPTTTPTTYRWYYLAWRPNPEAGTIVGYLVSTQQVANTQQPNVQEPGVPSYEVLLEAIEEFKGSLTEARHADFEARAAATGQWIYKWKTFGFSLPIAAEQELIAPLYRAFLDVRPRAYRFLNKPAGETAEDVQIVVNNTGRTIGLGLQTDWNIIYAYFNDEDFPQNRYVYALWYKVDVPRQCIVGELIEVNTERPNGGQVKPFVQMNVPPYLYRMSEPFATNTQGALNNVTMNGNAEQRTEGVVRYQATMQYSGSQHTDDIVPTVLDKSTFESYWLARGFDREGLALEYQSLTRRLQDDRSLYSEELRHYTEAYNATTADARSYMQASLDSVKDAFAEKTSLLNARRTALSRDDYERQMTALFEQYRQQLDTVTIHYKATVDALTAGYETGIRAIAARHPAEDILLTADGNLTPFGQRLFEQMLSAYRDEVSVVDDKLAVRIQLFVRALSNSANAETRNVMLTELRKAAKRGNRHASGRMIIKQSANILMLKQ